MKFLFGVVLLSFFWANAVAQNIRWMIDGEPQKLISVQDKHLTRPVWSPDGSMIAFSADNYRGIYLYDVGRQNWRQLTDDDAAGFAFSWSSDSRSILTVSAKYQELKRQNAVKSFRVDNGTQAILSDYKNDMPSTIQWMPDQSSLCFMRKGQLMSFGQNSAVQAQQIATLYFLDKGQIFSLETGLNKKRVLQPVKGKEYLNLTVSPGSSHLAFEVFGGNLYIFNVKTQELTDLGRGNRPAWSADGEWLCYMQAEDDGHAFTKSEIMVCDANGNNRQQMTDTDNVLEMSPNWSPDGLKMAVSNYSDGAIYVLPLRKQTAEK